MARARWLDGNRREFQNRLWPFWAVLAALAWVNVVLPLFYYSPLPRGAVTMCGRGEMTCKTASKIQASTTETNTEPRQPNRLENSQHKSLSQRYPPHGH